jgi:hypothetical protein
MSSNYEELMKQQETILSKAKSETGSGQPKDKARSPPVAPLDKKKVRAVNGRALTRTGHSRSPPARRPTKAANP